MSAPVLLNGTHRLEEFTCGIANLDDWLKRRALANQTGGASRTYVVAQDSRVIAYYCLASGGIAAIEAPGRIRRNMPDPIPIAVLGRLAVDSGWQGKGLGVALLQDAVLRTAQAAEIVGIRALVVHALSDAAKAFYLRFGFIESPSNPMTLLLSLKGFANPPKPR
ncbi:GNAT family N-acetyltransferase [Sphingosinithalassobacter tenebrarum]|uniref:GNAT family N-acetyltransferase n=1 Tax=Stakelama tenebrarum TaxID=2711215 RepID=A0A6G6YAA5_9SPHN|nr:GNAT family N-acetyltransferase [Sphingosinithalassobacter tenebrarum]